MTEPVCPLCQGETWIPRFVPWVDPHYSPCACRRANQLRQCLTAAGIPTEYQGCTVENYRAYTDTLIDARAIARGFIERYPWTAIEPQGPKGLLLIGQAGVGKTHLAAAILTAVIAKGHRGLFCTTRDLLRRMRDSYNPTIQTTERQIIEPVLTCELLVLDDLGAERLTEWVADTMDLIIDTRYADGRTTIVTTNFPAIDDSQNTEGLWWRVGFRTQSRLHKMCRFLTLDGADYRDVHPEASDRDLARLARQRIVASPTRTLRKGLRPASKDGAGDLQWSGGKGGNI